MKFFLTHKKHIRTACLFISIFLLLVNIIGVLWHPVLESEYVVQKKGTPGYDHPVLSKTVLLKMLKEKGNVADTSFVHNATRMVFHSMFHHEERRIGFYENWIMWLSGKIYQPLSRTQDSKLLVKGGAGNCSERTQVLMDIYKINGLDSRVISLNGHTALQVYFQDNWMITDPDYGLVYKADMHNMRAEAGLQYADSLLAIHGFSDKMRDRYLYYWQTGIDNVLMPLNEVSSLWLYKAEKTSQWLKWIIPALMLLICIIPLKRKNLLKGKVE